MQVIGTVKSMGNTLMVCTKYPMNLEDGEYVVEIRPVDKDKTRRQVNYFWALVREVAKKEDGNTQDVEKYYGTMLKMANVKIENIWVKSEALDELKKMKIRFIVMEESKGYSLIVIYKGISQMNNKEMQALIDVAITYAEKVGIKTDYWKEVLNG